MKTIIIIALAIRVIENFKIFDTLYIMTGGGPGVATETISRLHLQGHHAGPDLGLCRGDRAGHPDRAVDRLPSAP